MSALTYQEQSLINSLDTRVRELAARVEQLEKQLAEILKGQNNNGN
ncbi:MAG: hypothetical protein ABR881_00560 [Candidatus Sulfotelmatobacter sp.]|jgi:outer membrane murein-binding lipoprotein Lpp